MAGRKMEISPFSYAFTLLFFGVAIMGFTMYIDRNIYDWEKIDEWERKATLYDETFMALDGELLPWCVAEDRGPIIPEFRANMALIYWPLEIDPNDGQYGEASWMLDEELNITTCEIDSPQPTRAWGDIKMDTFGHEVAHCFLGDYHTE